MPERRPRTNAARPEKLTASGTKRLIVSVYGEETTKLEEMDIHTFETEPAYVRVNAGTTKNLGNFESLRIDVSISVPCYVELVGRTFEAVAQEVSEKLYSEVEAYLGKGDK
jgi:hypothetical protein